jgi:sarcosine oxidase delta subunit
MLYIYYRDVNYNLQEAWIHLGEYREWLKAIQPLVIYKKQLIN